MGSPRPPGAADRLLRSRAPRARRLADERRAFGAPTDFVTPARLKRFASLSKRARRSITSFSRPRSRSLSSSRVVIVDERSLSLSLSRARGSTRKKTPRRMTARPEPSRSFRDAMPSPRDAPPTVRARPNSTAHGDTFVVVVDERARASRRRAGRRVARQEDRRVASLRGADHRDSRGDDASGRRARAETTGEGARAHTHNFSRAKSSARRGSSRVARGWRTIGMGDARARVVGRVNELVTCRSD